VAFIGTAFTGISGVLASVRSVDPSLNKQASSVLRRILDRFGHHLLHAAEAITIPVLAIFVALEAIVWGAGMPPWEDGWNTWTDGVEWWFLPAVVVALVWWRGNITAWSPHGFYRDRLGAAFNLRWHAHDQPGLSPTAMPLGSPDHRCYLDVRPRDDSTMLDSMQPAGTPELLVCASANVSDYGVTPTGAHVTSFVMSSRFIGGPGVGAMPTTTYLERTVNRTSNLNLLTAIAIAGGAVAPEMGRMTRPQLRKLLTVANIRLGVWLPNPRQVAAGAGVTFGKDLDDKLSERPPRYRYIHRANPLYLIKELFGWNSINGKYLYVSDGGHYDNLGLVELLRRGCKWIWCIDASGDPPGKFTTLGQALALAQGELGVTVTGLQPEETMASEPDEARARNDAGKPPLAKEPWCQGMIRYPDGNTGTLVYVKAAVTAATPWDVRSFQESNPTFPCDPTYNQLYTGDRVDAYRTLGSWAVSRAWQTVGSDFESFRNLRRASTPPVAPQSAAPAADHPELQPA
jgi:hypothetical protein